MAHKGKLKYGKRGGKKGMMDYSGKPIRGKKTARKASKKKYAGMK